MARRPLRGSERRPFPHARVVGPADPQERLEVTVLLRRRDFGRARQSLTAVCVDSSFIIQPSSFPWGGGGLQ